MKQRKIIVLAIVAISIVFTACTKTKTYSLPGTYKSEDIYMKVDTSGQVMFQKINQSKKLEGITVTLSSLYPINLIPWDLTEEKTSYTFEGKEEITKWDTNTSTNTYYNVDYKFVFTSDKKNINLKSV